MKVALIVIGALAISSCSTSSQEQTSPTIPPSLSANTEEGLIRVNASSGNFSVACGGGVIEGVFRSIYPVLWKVPGQPDKIVFQRQGTNSTILVGIAACGTGVVATGANFNNDKFITYSTDCQNLMGGGATKLTLNSKDIGAVSITSDSRGGVNVRAYNNKPSPPKFAEFYSPDCLNPVGGGQTEVIRGWQ